MASIGRNDLCPCGSGVKYKKCCMAAEAPSTVAPAHAIDNQVMPVLVRYAMEHYDRSVVPEFQSRPWLEASIPLLNAWLVFHRPMAEGPPGGRQGENAGRIVEQFLRDTPTLPPRARAWLQAQAAARLSVWKVQSVEPGLSFTAVDVLNGDVRTVRERSASRGMVPGLSVLARLVDFDGYTVLATMHPSGFTPLQAHNVLMEAKSHEPWALLVAWEATAAALAERPPNRPTNNDGDAIELLTLEFSAFEQWLEPLRAVVPPELELVEAGPNAAVLQDRSPSRWVVAHLQRRKRRLEAQVNSRRRAELVKTLLESASMPCKGERPLDFREYQRTMNPTAPSPEALLAFKTKHYEGWADEAIPALGGQTPRQASTTPEGRQRLEALLADLSFFEARLPPQQRYDFNLLREQLLAAR